MDSPSSLASVVPGDDDALYTHAKNVAAFQSELVELSRNKAGLAQTLGRLKDRARKPRDEFAHHLVRLQNAHQLMDQLSCVLDVFKLMKQLHGVQPTNEMNILRLASIASNVHAVTTLLEGGSMKQLDVIHDEYKQHVLPLHNTLLSMAKDQLSRGLDTQNQQLVSDALQLYKHLGRLTECVESLLEEYGKTIDREAKQAFDMSSIQKEARSTVVNNKVRRHAEIQILWRRIESLLDTAHQLATRVAEMEKVLGRKRDSATQVLYLNVVLEHVDELPLKLFWQRLAAALVRELNQASRASLMIQQTFEQGYPRLTRLLMAFYGKMDMLNVFHTTAATTPEGAFVFRSLSSFESAYVHKCRLMLEEAALKAFAQKGAPIRGELVNLPRILLRELEAVKFDTACHAKIAALGVDVIVFCETKLQNKLVHARDFAIGQGICTPSQFINIEVCNAIDALQTAFQHTLHDTIQLYQPILTSLTRLQDVVVHPMKAMFIQTLSQVLDKMHDETGPLEAAYSPFMHEFSRKFIHLTNEYVTKFASRGLVVSWTFDMCATLLHYYVLSALVSPQERLEVDGQQWVQLMQKVSTKCGWKLHQVQTLVTLATRQELPHWLTLHLDWHKAGHNLPQILDMTPREYVRDMMAHDWSIAHTKHLLQSSTHQDVTVLLDLIH